MSWIRICRGLAGLSMSVLSSTGFAAPLIESGDVLLRNDLQLLVDEQVIDVPVTAWPLAAGDLYRALESVDQEEIPGPAELAFLRVRKMIQSELAIGEWSRTLAVSGSIEPRFLRGFDDTPRDEGEIAARFSWIGERLSLQLAATVVANPFDGDDFRPDGSYLGIALGNWMLTAGWQAKWWGPGRDGSLILSTNSRPAPGIALQRNVSMPFESRWLSWLGPWTLMTFVSELDDSRAVSDARLFGIRASFRPPHTGLEIGLSRAAQWCGDNRPCDLEAFSNLLLGNDNRNVNVAPEDEPGNQLGGIDIRWRLPGNVPAAVYMQWIGEDGRGGGGAIGSWLRQVGMEHWGAVGRFSHRTHVEISDTTCRQGGFGFSGAVPNCAYEHSIYQTGYRYRGRAIGFATDGDSRSYSLGSTLVQSAGQSWNLSLRYMKINRDGSNRPTHTVSVIPTSVTDMLLTHDRQTRIGQISFGVGVSRMAPQLSDSKTELSGFVRWRSQ